MNRIDIEGAIPFSGVKKGRHQTEDGQDHGQKKSIFNTYCSLALTQLNQKKRVKRLLLL